MWARIATLFFECCAEDNKIFYILDQEDYIINKADLKCLWKKLELIQWISQFDQKKITELFLNNFFIEEIISHLLSSYNVQVSIKTLKHYLTDWNIKKWVKTKNSS